MGEGAQPGTADKEIRQRQHADGFCHLTATDMNRRGRWSFVGEIGWPTLVGHQMTGQKCGQPRSTILVRIE